MFKHHCTQWGLAWVFLLSLLMGLFLFGCNEAPFAPKDDEPVVKDYKVWFTNVGVVEQTTLYAYHTATHVIDTFDLAYEPTEGLTVSADGKLLYLAQKTSVVVVDTDSLQIITELLYEPRTAVAVSPDNEFLAIMGDDLHILRTSDYSVIFSDTVRNSHIWFSTDSRTLYAVSSHVLKVMFTDMGEVVDTSLTATWVGGASQIIPTPDESKWLIYSNRSGLWTWSFEVYDILNDSIIFSEFQQPGAGYLAMTPDGRYAFYGNPGTLSPGPMPDSSFTVFDIEANAIDRVVPIQRTINGVEAPWPYIIGEMVVTPDGRWLVLFDALPAHQLILYDLEKQQWVDYNDFGTHNVELLWLTVQSAP